MAGLTMAAAGTPLNRRPTVLRTGNDARWAAVVARDARLDGEFVYAVRTTGVYCRPSCPSRQALRVNVQFFATPHAAESAGYRACRRCDPRSDGTRAQDAIQRARAYLEAHVDENVSLDRLGRVAGMSPHHLQRTFTGAVGVSPKRYLAALRAERMKQELKRGATVSRASFEAGYGASSRMYDSASAQLGMTPAAYRRGGEGVAIRYATVGTVVGRALVAATPRGVCAVTLGDDDATLEAALEAEYPRAQLERVRLEGAAGDEALREWTAALQRHLEGADLSLAVPLDVPGTAFQQRVWGALRDIPYGETRSYSEVAAAIGAPAAVRAVAGACARNRVALVVPCHRVVSRDGSAGGYRWGSERKERLLAAERGVLAHGIRRVRRTGERRPRSAGDVRGAG